MAVYRAWRAGKTGASRLGAAGIAAVAVIGWTRLAQGTPASGWLAMPAAAVACSAVYVVIGVLVLALAAGYQLRGIRRVPGQPSGPAGHEHPEPLDEPSGPATPDRPDLRASSAGGPAFPRPVASERAESGQGGPELAQDGSCAGRVLEHPPVAEPVEGDRPGAGSRGGPGRRGRAQEGVLAGDDHQSGG
jgi:hypothetical protein